MDELIDKLNEKLSLDANQQLLLSIEKLNATMAKFDAYGDVLKQFEIDPYDVEPKFLEFRISVQAKNKAKKRKAKRKNGGPK